MSDPQWNALSNSGIRGDYEKFSSLDVESVLRWRSLGKPLICILKGYVIYHACSLAGIADVVIASDSTRYMPTMVQAFMLPWDMALNAKKVGARRVFAMRKTCSRGCSFSFGWYLDPFNLGPRSQPRFARSQVKEILLTGRFILPHEGEELGLFNRVVPAGTEDEEGMRMADLICKARDPFQARMIKVCLAGGAGLYG